MINEVKRDSANGIAMLLVLLVVIAAAAAAAIRGGSTDNAILVVIAAAAFVVAGVLLSGLFTGAQPGPGASALRRLPRHGPGAGSPLAIPSITKRAISLRVRNFETAKLKVNDRGQPRGDRHGGGLAGGRHRGGRFPGGQL